MYSKKVKLPKKLWVKGCSKFLFCRLMEDRQTKNLTKNMIKKLKWYQKLYGFTIGIFKKIKK